MDISDAFLATAKCINVRFQPPNFLLLERCDDLSSSLAKIQYTEPPEVYSSVAFASFVVVWSYFRHFLNLKILWNVWDDVRLLSHLLSLIFVGR